MPVKTMTVAAPKRLLFPMHMSVAVYCRVGSMSQVDQLRDYSNTSNLLIEPSRMGEIEYHMMKLRRNGTAKKGW